MKLRVILGLALWTVGCAGPVRPIATQTAPDVDDYVAVALREAGDQ
jgi:hypothetical protein